MYDRRGNGGTGDGSDTDSVGDPDTDSNDEGNWRNDYPDSGDDDGASVGSEDMRHAVANMNMGRFY